MAAPVSVDHEWYLPILIWIPAVALLGGLIFTLRSGKLYARGTAITRQDDPATYWIGAAFLVVFSLFAIYLAMWN